MEHKIRILGIAPYEGMQLLMQKVVQEFPQIELTAMVGDLDKGVEVAQNNFHSDYDIIISRGGTAQLLRKKVDLPVVEIPITEYDILRALRLVENVSGTFAIVGFSNITENAYYLSEVLSVEPKLFTIHHASETYDIVHQAWESGYRTVLCDVIATSAAKQLGMNAMLISSGPNSIKKAFYDSILLYESLTAIRSENSFLRKIICDQSNDTVVFDKNGNLYFSTLEANKQDAIINMLHSEIENCSSREPVRMIKSIEGTLYSIKAQQFSTIKGTFTTFYFSHSKVPFVSSKSGIQYYTNAQAKQIFYNSFYSSAGDILGLENSINQISTSDSPIMLIGEEGTGKESVATILYSRGQLKNHPLISINCALLNSKSWEYLITNHNSPFTDSQTTIYLSQIDALSEEKSKQLLAVLIDMDVCKRNSIILSSTISVNGTLPEIARVYADKLCCFILKLPALRELHDNIPALIHLYLNELSISQITDIIGMEDGAIKKLQDFPWYHNLSQFKRVLQELVTTSQYPIIREVDVERILSLENSSPTISGEVISKPIRFDLNRTLADMEKQIISIVLNECGGNQSIAAKRLGISRTTLWRYCK